MICKYCGSKMDEDEHGFDNGVEYSIYVCTGGDCNWMCTLAENRDVEWEGTK